MLLFKNHKAMTLIYRRNQGDNFLGFFFPFKVTVTKRVHIRLSHFKVLKKTNKNEKFKYFCFIFSSFFSSCTLFKIVLPFM